MIVFKDVSYSYTTPTGSTEALCGVNAVLRRGMITAVIGHTGSGKSTFMELAAGISKPCSGEVTLDGDDISNHLRKIGTVFQYPEYQLFADTVREDIAFGPSNYGLKGKALEECIYRAAEITGLSNELLSRSPFELSGGQKRMAAVAGVLALDPEILLLDEPAAGLDPSGRKLIFEIMHKLLEKNSSMIIVFVTHSMEDAAENADDIILLDHGCIAASGAPRDIFARKELLLSCGLDIPESAKIADELRHLGADIGSVVTADDTYFAVKAYIEKERNRRDAS